MKDLAKYTGLSLGTVSNYINGKVPVSKEKGDCIEKAIEDLGYTVNVTARTLKTKNYNCIGVLIPAFSNQFMLKVIKYIELMLTEYHYDMLVLSYNNHMDNLYKQLKFLKQRTDGILCVPMQGMNLDVFRKNKKIPIITFDEATDEVVGDRVLVNNTQIVENAINRIIGKGHTRIGLIAGRKNDYTTLQRRIGYENALIHNGLPVLEKNIIYGNYEKESGFECCKQLIEQDPQITAIFVVGYFMTLGVLAALKELKMEYKIDVIGYDASDVADIINSNFGYVYQPYLEIARALVNLIMKRVKGDYSDYPTTEIVKAEIRDADFIKKN